MTDKQLEANRLNALKSTGPRTEEGKERSRLNAMRHGLTGQVSIMTEEERIAHHKFSEPIMQKLAPEGALEVQYAQLIVQDHWRLNRLHAIENSLLALGESRPGTLTQDSGHPQIDTAFTHAKVFHADSNKVALLSVYESRIIRNIKRNTEQLNALQAKRAEQLAQALEEAELLAELAAHEGRTFDPLEFGFVFSPSEIARRIEKKRQLNRARELRKLHSAAAKIAA